MARRNPQPEATQEKVLDCIHRHCSNCGQLMHNDYDNYRKVRTLKGVVQLRLRIRRCPNQSCSYFHRAYRPEAEGKWALPHHEFGLDVIALVGTLRYQQHRSIAQIHQQLQHRGVCVCERTVSNLLDRYDELLAVKLSDVDRLNQLFKEQQQVLLAIDGLQPDVGHEVLWVIRECISGEILLAKPLLSSASKDIAELLSTVEQNLSVPIVGIISDGQQSIRKAVRQALPKKAHGLCHFHYLREATKPIYEADRHAKKELKKQVRGIRTIERSATDPNDPMTEVTQGYCQAVRSALTDDGHPPLDAPGLRLQQRLSAIDDSLDRVAKKGSYRQHYQN